MQYSSRYTKHYPDESNLIGWQEKYSEVQQHFSNRNKGRLCTQANGIRRRRYPNKHTNIINKNIVFLSQEKKQRSQLVSTKKGKDSFKKLSAQHINLSVSRLLIDIPYLYCTSSKQSINQFPQSRRILKMQSSRIQKQKESAQTINDFLNSLSFQLPKQSSKLQSVKTMPYLYVNHKRACNSVINRFKGEN